ncbi:MAG: hypothetical protein DRQ10_03140 [Candidatus Hydrothermota bacterium]|nr:MAG: hypothetical protein DRQ10_03140 [Candidatus Hydrothermae bacterium]
MKDSLGIEIAGNAVRYVQIGGGRVTAVDEIRGNELDFTLNKVKEATAWDKAVITVSLAEFHARKVPSMDDELLNILMRMHLGKDFIWQKKGGFLAIAPKGTLQAIYNALYSAGIQTMAIEISPFSVLRTYFENYPERRSSNAVIAYFTEVASSLCFIKSGTPILIVTRPIDEPPEETVKSMVYLGDMTFEASPYEVFTCGNIEYSKPFSDSLRGYLKDANIYKLDPFRQVKGLGLPLVRATIFSAALGAALREIK